MCCKNVFYFLNICEGVSTLLPDETQALCEIFLPQSFLTDVSPSNF